MYYIASIAKFGNHCSTVWAHRQDQWEGNNYSLSFLRMREKNLHVVFTTYFRTWFSIPAYYNIFRYRKLPNASISYCSDDLAQLHRLLPCLDLWSLWSEIISVREKNFPSIYITHLNELTTHLHLCWNCTPVVCTRLWHHCYPTNYHTLFPTLHWYRSPLCQHSPESH